MNTQHEGATMKKNIRPVPIAAVVALASAVATPTPARADLFGGDVAVLTGILTETIQQGIHLHEQLNRIREHVENSKQTLKRLSDVSSFHDALSFYNTTRFNYESLVSDVNAISYSAQRVKGDFDRLFPKDQSTWQGVPSSQFKGRYAAWNEELTSSALIASRAQTQMMNVQQMNERAARALSISQAEGGEVRQLQAMNQMLAVMQNQLNSLVQLLSTGSRVTSDLAATTAGKDMMLQEGKRRRRDGYTNPGPPPRRLKRLP
jgi:P-type conjugative transfer protein TrbJ